MNLSKKLLTLLAIFCVIASAGVACAADADSDVDGTYLSATDDMGEIGDQADFEDVDYTTNDGGWAGSQYNGNVENGPQGAPEIDPDYAHNEAAGEPINATGNTTADTTGNATAQVAQNTTANATSSSNMLSTGNPVLLLLGVTAVLGAGAVLRRKN